MKTTILGKETDIIAPKIEMMYFGGSVHVAVLSHKNVYKACGTFTDSRVDGYRHPTLAELTDIVGNERNPAAATILAAQAFETFQPGIWTNESIRREGNKLIVYAGIDGKLGEVIDGYDCINGYSTDKKLQGDAFDIERLFRKYVPKDNDVPLKHLEKANPELVERLYGKPYEALPELLRESIVELPPDCKNEAVIKEWYAVNAWPLALQIRSENKRDKNLVTKEDEIDLDTLQLTKATLTPYERAFGIHVFVKETPTGHASYCAQSI